MRVAAPGYQPVYLSIPGGVRDVPVVVELREGSTISGRVTDERGSAVPAAFVYVASIERGVQHYPGGAATRWSHGALTVTDERGEFLIAFPDEAFGSVPRPRGRQFDEYAIGVQAEGFAPAVSPPLGASATELNADASVVLRRGLTLRGRVRSADPAEAPLITATICTLPPGIAEPWPPRLLGADSSGQRALTGDDGNFELRGCPAVPFFVDVSSPGFHPARVRIADAAALDGMAVDLLLAR